MSMTKTKTSVLDWHKISVDNIPSIDDQPAAYFKALVQFGLWEDLLTRLAEPGHERWKKVALSKRKTSNQILKICSKERLIAILDSTTDSIRGRLLRLALQHSQTLSLGEEVSAQVWSDPESHIWSERFFKTLLSLQPKEVLRAAIAARVDPAKDGAGRRRFGFKGWDLVRPKHAREAELGTGAFAPMKLLSARKEVGEVFIDVFEALLGQLPKEEMLSLPSVTSSATVEDLTATFTKLLVPSKGLFSAHPNLRLRLRESLLNAPFVFFAGLLTDYLEIPFIAPTMALPLGITIAAMIQLKVLTPQDVYGTLLPRYLKNAAWRDVFTRGVMHSGHLQLFQLLRHAEEGHALANSWPAVRARIVPIIVQTLPEGDVGPLTFLVNVLDQTLSAPAMPQNAFWVSGREALEMVREVIAEVVSQKEALVADDAYTAALMAILSTLLHADFEQNERVALTARKSPFFLLAAAERDAFLLELMKDPAGEQPMSPVLACSHALVPIALLLLLEDFGSIARVLSGKDEDEDEDEKRERGQGGERNGFGKRELGVGEKSEPQAYVHVVEQFLVKFMVSRNSSVREGAFSLYEVFLTKLLMAAMNNDSLRAPAAAVHLRFCRLCAGPIGRRLPERCSALYAIHAFNAWTAAVHAGEGSDWV
jgi:hypothetical protein